MPEARSRSSKTIAQKYILNKNLSKIIVKNKKLRFPIPKIYQKTS